MITIKNNTEKKPTEIKAYDIPEGTVFTGTLVGVGAYYGTLFVRGFEQIISLQNPTTNWNHRLAELTINDYQPVNITITVDGPADE